MAGFELTNLAVTHNDIIQQLGSRDITTQKCVAQKLRFKLLLTLAKASH